MAPPKRKAGGRVTPKGTRPGASGLPRAERDPLAGSGGPHRAAEPSSRYTPPVPKSMKSSPVWVPVLMFGLLIAGALVIVLNYLELLPGSPENLYLVVGLVLILGGIIAATQYR